MTDVELAGHFGTEAHSKINMLLVWRDKQDAVHIFPQLALAFEYEAYPLARAAGHYALRQQKILNPS